MVQQYRSGDGARVLWVWQITRYIKEALDSDPMLADIWVRGEISNFKHHHSGHMYFTLKDEHSNIRCVMFRQKNSRLGFRPENGQRVVARGAVTVYERDGQYQLYVEEMAEDGLGDLHRAFLELKERLDGEGLFDPRRKRPLPLIPTRVGVVTSATGAAVRDIISVGRRRFPNCLIVIVPVLVQGPEAPAQIVRALASANRRALADVLIVGRGGGSIEELWAFNDERVARAIFASNIPVVSAVGHETDTTIADLVADVRAATPSAAAELVFPARSELSAQVAALLRHARRCAVGRVDRCRQRLDRAVLSPAFARPHDRLDQRRQFVDDLSRRAAVSAAAAAGQSRHRVSGVVGRLEALSPQAVIARGYSVCRRPDGTVVTVTGQVSAGDQVEVVVRDGIVDCSVSGSKAFPTPAKGGRSPCHARMRN